MVLLGGEMKAKKYKQKHKFEVVESFNGFYLYFWNGRKVAHIGTNPLGDRLGEDDAVQLPEAGTPAYLQAVIEMVDEEWSDYKEAYFSK